MGTSATDEPWTTPWRDTLDEGRLRSERFDGWAVEAFEHLDEQGLEGWVADPLVIVPHGDGPTFTDSTEARKYARGLLAAADFCDVVNDAQAAAASASGPYTREPLPRVPGATGDLSAGSES